MEWLTESISTYSTIQKLNEDKRTLESWYGETHRAPKGYNSIIIERRTKDGWNAQSHRCKKHETIEEAFKYLLKKGKQTKGEIYNIVINVDICSDRVFLTYTVE